MVAGLMFGLASKSKSPSHLSRGNPAALTRRTEERRSRSSTLGQQQLGQESLVGQLLLPRDGQGFVDQGPDRGQPQPAAGLVDGGDRRLVRSGRAVGAGWG